MKEQARFVGPITMLLTAVKVAQKGWRVAGKLNLGNVELSRTSSAFTLHYACG
jgi:hypothetical protein